LNHFEAVWAYREETIYPSRFGNVGKEIFTLQPDIFLTRFNQETFDPRWTYYGVLECQPTERRDSWLYVSSGMSNPWEVDPSEYSEDQISGLGLEFVLEAPVRSPWAIEVLHQMIAFNILLSCGRFGDKPMLDVGDRVPLKNSITRDFESALRNLVVTAPDHFQPAFTLASGTCRFLHFIGITDDELRYAKEHGSDTLVHSLKQQGVYPLSDPRRPSISLP
jgi:hypothetical protein